MPHSQFRRAVDVEMTPLARRAVALLAAVPIAVLGWHALATNFPTFAGLEHRVDWSTTFPGLVSGVGAVIVTLLIAIYGRNWSIAESTSLSPAAKRARLIMYEGLSALAAMSIVGGIGLMFVLSIRAGEPSWQGGASLVGAYIVGLLLVESSGSAFADALKESTEFREEELARLRRATAYWSPGGMRTSEWLVQIARVAAIAPTLGLAWALVANPGYVLQNARAIAGLMVLAAVLSAFATICAYGAAILGMGLVANRDLGAGGTLLLFAAAYVAHTTLSIGSGLEGRQHVLQPLLALPLLVPTLVVLSQLLLPGRWSRGGAWRPAVRFGIALTLLRRRRRIRGIDDNASGAIERWYDRISGMA